MHHIRYHIVDYGDTLATLAKLYYGEASLGTVIYQHNRHYISDPNMLYPGQKICIPHLHPIRDEIVELLT
jgi:nucleoid-associated protein YgaU